MRYGKAFAYARHYAERLGCCRRTVRRCIVRLVAAGRIEHERVKAGGFFADGKRTTWGGQHNWPITRAHARRMKKREQRRAVEKAKRAKRAREREELLAKLARATDEAIAKTPPVVLMPPPETFGACVRVDARPAEPSDDERRAELARQLAALAAMVDRGEPPDT